MSDLAKILIMAAGVAGFINEKVAWGCVFLAGLLMLLGK